MPRWRLALDDSPASAAPPGTPSPDPADDVVSVVVEADPDDESAFHTLIILEGVWTGDRRTFAEGSLTWRDLPFPLMATDRTSWQHEDAVLIGNVEVMERRGAELHGWGHFISEPEGDAWRLIGLVQRGELRGVSADVDAVEWELLLPPMDEDPFFDDEAELPTTPEGDIVIGMEDPKQRVTQGRVMGATVVPFPALQECFIEVGGEPAPAVTAEAPEAPQDAPEDEALVAAAITIPDAPPAAWFADPQLTGPTPFTVSDDGRIFGHIAAWGDCHISFPDQCVPPPRSLTQYACFRLHTTLTAEGSRIPTGVLTSRGGHADRYASTAEAMAHYDNTASAVADIACGEDQYGIWVAGALRPHVTPEDCRTVMSSGVSGDWRPYGGGLELVALTSVNVPGFPRRERMAQFTEEAGLVASAIVDLRPVRHGRRQTAASNRRTIDRIAASIGHRPADRIRQLAARVHQES